MGNDRIDEIFDPEIAINRAIDYYRIRGYDDKWIESRLISNKNSLNYKYIDSNKFDKKLINGKS